MGIYIANFEKPTSCVTCKFRTRGCLLMGRVPLYDKSRTDPDCPLEEIQIEEVESTEFWLKRNMSWRNVKGYSGVVQCPVCGEPASRTQSKEYKCCPYCGVVLKGE